MSTTWTFIREKRIAICMTMTSAVLHEQTIRNRLLLTWCLRAAKKTIMRGALHGTWISYNYRMAMYGFMFTQASADFLQSVPEGNLTCCKDGQTAAQVTHRANSSVSTRMPRIPSTLVGDKSKWQREWKSRRTCVRGAKSIYS